MALGNMDLVSSYSTHSKYLRESSVFETLLLNVTVL